VHGDDAVYDVQEAASGRCKTPISTPEWEEIERVTFLTDRCILDNASPEYVCWKHRGMMEFYCGVYLARNTQTGWIESDQGQGTGSVRCGDERVRARANDPEWYWAWRFAAEMNEDVWQEKPKTLVASLSALFDRPNSGTRPTELMYRAWEVLEKVPGGKAVLDKFQAEFRQKVGARGAEGEIARQLLPEGRRKRPKTTKRKAAKEQYIPNFIQCPAGEFLMGAGDDDSDASDDERPQHGVAVSSFFMQSTPVTRAQYRLFDGQHEVAHEGDFQECAPEDDCPVICATWYDAWVFARWIGGRLPTEAEWEYACRAGTADPFSFDKGGKLDEYAWYTDNAGGQTHPVATKKPNPWNHYDMHGNVWEWCQDVWHDNYEGAPTDGSAWGGEGTNRVSRGSSWLYDAGYCRCACRNFAVPGNRYHDLGFRLVLAARANRGSRPFS
jgi:formylglycine-generating enzyme required for sulfatase activity